MRRLIPILFALTALNSVAQDYTRVAPQVTSTTIILNQNMDQKKLKDQFLYALKNTNDENYQAIYLIIEASVKVAKDNLSSQIWGLKENELRFLIKTLSSLSEEDLLKKLKNNIDEKRFGLEISICAKKKLEKWAGEVPEKVITKGRLGNKILRRITGLLELGLISYEQFKPGATVNVNALALDALKTLPAIIGLDINEADRLKAIAEIVFTLQNRIEDFRFNSSEGGKFNLKISEQSSINLKDALLITNHDLLLKVLEVIENELKSELIDRLGFENPAVIYFDTFYSKIKAKAITLKDNPGLMNPLILPIADFVSDFENFKKRTKTFTSYKTDLGKQYFKQAWKEADSIHQKFAREYYLNSFVEVIGEFVGDNFGEVLKNPTKIAWLNNFSFSESQPELSTTLAYKLVNRPFFVWELSTNAFFNQSSKKDTSKTNGLGNRTIIGTSFKILSKNEKWEVSFNGAASSQVISKIGDLSHASPDAYAGLSIATKWHNIIFRPYYEYEIQRTVDKVDNTKNEKTEVHNTGLELKFPRKFILGGLFLNYKFNGISSIGITFPTVK